MQHSRKQDNPIPLTFATYRKDMKNNINKKHHLNAMYTPIIKISQRVVLLLTLTCFASYPRLNAHINSDSTKQKHETAKLYEEIRPCTKKHQEDTAKLNEQAQNGYWGDMGDGTYRNPIIAADFSDPDPIRVGDDFYMVTSTFETSPGVTVLHSKDLVNWEIIGAVFDDLSKVSPAFSFRKMRRYNGGVYAPCIRYHKGKFYVYVNLYTDGMFVATTRNPAGKWDVQPLKDKFGQPLQVEGWTDPCPIWDENGNAYLASSTPGKNWFGYLFQMSPDGTQLLDAETEHMKQRGIVYEYPKGGTLYSRNYSTEGNKLYRRNGYYYLLHIEFLDGGNGAGTYVYRSRNLYGTKADGSPGTPGDIGTYEIKRIDPHGNPYRQVLPGQGGLVDTPDGRWYWIAQFNRYGSDGRTPCLVPVTWIDDWPVIGDSVSSPNEYGKMCWRAAKPVQSSHTTLPHGSDDFSFSTLKKLWAWNHQPDSSHWSLSVRPGFLRLYADATADSTDSFFKAANTLHQRYMSSDTVIITIKVDVTGTTQGQKAGLTHFNGGVHYAFCGIADYGNSKHIIYEADGKSKNGPRLPSNLKTLYIRSVSGFEKRDTNRQYTTEGQHFLYSIDGQNFYPFGDEYRLGTGNFRGDMVGICTYNNQNNGGYIDVDKFHYHIKNKPATRP